MIPLQSEISHLFSFTTAFLSSFFYPSCFNILFFLPPSLLSFLSSCALERNNIPSATSCPSFLFLPTSLPSFLDVHYKKSYYYLSLLAPSAFLSSFPTFLPYFLPFFMCAIEKQSYCLLFLLSLLTVVPPSLFSVPLFHLHFIHPSFFFLPPFFSFLPSFLISYLPSFLFDLRSSFFAFSLLSFLPHFLLAILLFFLLPSLLSSFPFFMYGRKKGGAQKKQ